MTETYFRFKNSYQIKEFIKWERDTHVFENVIDTRDPQYMNNKKIGKKIAMQIMTKPS
jgi:hypothetical protein